MRVLWEKANRKKEARNANGVSENERESKKLHELFLNQEFKSVKSRKSMPEYGGSYCVQRSFT